MRPDTLIHRTDTLLEAQVDGELVALGLDTDTCYGFNPTATRVWALIADPIRFDAVVDTLVGEFAVSRAECESGIAALLDDLLRDDLVRLMPPA